LPVGRRLPQARQAGRGPPAARPREAATHPGRRWLRAQGGGSIFVGTVPGTFDAKKARISVPAAFRAVLSRFESNELIGRKSDHSPCLEIWPRATFDEEVQRRIADLDPFARDYEKRVRRLVAHVHPLQPDTEGRTVLPRELSDKAGLDGDIVFSGRLKYFQIWNKVRWAEVEAADAAEDEEAAA
jgi:MraZ protein